MTCIYRRDCLAAGLLRFFTARQQPPYVQYCDSATTGALLALRCKLAGMYCLCLCECYVAIELVH